MEKRIWNEEEFFNEAKKYNSIKEFREKAEWCYSAIKRRKLLSKLYLEHNMKNINETHTFLTLEEIIEEAKKYSNRGECRIKNLVLYKKLYTRKMLDECYPIEIKKIHVYTRSFESCKNKAEQYISISNFKRYEYSYWRTAKDNDWLDEITKNYKHVR